ncbi:MAG: L-threonylcarbamoyladenylate synthase [Lentisphaerota bacterium]
MDSAIQKTRPLEAGRPGPALLESAALALRKGLLVVLPTETVYGLAGDLSQPGVLEKMYRAKGRPETKPIPLFAPSLELVKACGAEFSPAALRLAEAFWPGPLTLVLMTGKEFVGFRVPDYLPALMLLKAFGGILGVTSANRSGEPAAVTAQEADRALGSEVAMILDAGRSPGGVPSTVVKVEGSSVEILREGAISAVEIQKVADGT